MERTKISEQLKRFSPASLKVELRDGTDKPVAVPKSGNRWSRTQQVLDALQWVRIECLDKEGRVVGVVEDDEELDAIVDEAETDGNIAKLLLEVMRTTMKESRQMVDVQMRAMTATMSAIVEGQAAVVESYRTALAVQQQHLLAAPSGDEKQEMMQMFQMAMALMQQQRAAAAKPAGG